MTAPTIPTNYSNPEAASEFISTQYSLSPVPKEIKCLYLGRSIVYLPTSSTLLTHDLTEWEVGYFTQKLLKKNIPVLNSAEIVSGKSVPDHSTQKQNTQC